MKLVALAILAALVASSCAGPSTVQRTPGSPAEEPAIRVLLAEGLSSLTVSAERGCSVTAAGISLLESRDRCAVRVTAGGGEIGLALEPGGRVAAAQGPVRIAPYGGSPLAFDASTYAGSMTVVGDPDGRLILLNVLPLEIYLEGVVPHEIGNPGVEGFDALEAQAVAARTYALDRINMHAAEPFDVEAGVRDQVYQGLRGKSNQSSAAVSQTRGIVLSDGDGLVKAYYCSTCGGHTSDIRRVWPKREPAPYLYGIPDRDEGNAASFCRESRYFRWRYSFTGKELGDMLRKTIPQTLGVKPSGVGEVLDVRAGELTESGRVSQVSIRTTKGEFTVVGDEIRWVLMADPGKGRILPSIMFKLEKVMEGGRVAFLSIAGGGNGHGVGMCQNGAIAMAKKGYTYRMILRHYYPGCDLMRAYE